MDFDTIRPIISGSIGGVIAIFLYNKWSKDLPKSFNNKSRSQLIRENKGIIRTANILFILSIAAAFLVYKFGIINRNDWRGFALFVGFGCFSPLICMYLFYITRGSKRVGEAFVAYSISQRTPAKLLFIIMLLGSIAFFAAIGSIIT